jgi:hypothetical protein
VGRHHRRCRGPARPGRVGNRPFPLSCLYGTAHAADHDGMSTQQPAAAVIPLLVAGRLLGIGRTAAYSGAKLGELAPSVRVIRAGRKRWVVPIADVERAIGRSVEP